MFSGEAMPGKMEASFEQWYHEVQCAKDHYPESRKHSQVIKGGSSGYGPVHGPTTSVAHILQKLTTIFGTVVSFDIQMQNFYNVAQGNHEKDPSFATRLEGTLNQIRLQCPRRITH